MNCAIYVRVSTTEQANEGYSISAQKQRLMAYAQSQGWQVVGLYADEGISAKNTDRPDLQRMISDIKNGLIDVVLVYKLDRLTRSVLDLYELLSVFEKYDCKFKSATEVYDTTTAIGRMFLTLVAALAQFERENLAERVRMGMREKVRQGNFSGSMPPLGYDRGDKRLAINDAEALLVKRIFNMYISGMGLKKIAIALSQEGIPTKKGKKYWQEGTLRDTLSNPIYIGKVRWGVRMNKDDFFTAEDPSLRIMSDELFERAQKVRKARSHSKGRAATSDYIFSGILHCAQCGSPMIGKLSGKGRQDNKYVTHSYKCANRDYHRCTMSTVSEKIVENAFVEYVKNIDIRRQISAATEEMSKSNTDHNKEIKRMRKALDKIKERRKKWQYAWGNGMIDDDDFTQRMSEEKEKEELIRSELDKVDDHQTKISGGKEAIDKLSGYVDHWNELETKEKKQLVQILIKNIVVQYHKAYHYRDRVEIKEIVFN